MYRVEGYRRPATRLRQGESKGPDVFLRSPAAPIPVSTPDVLSDACNQDSPTRRNTDQIALRTQWEGNDITVTAITAYRDSDLFEDADVETSDQHPIFARHSYPARNAFRT